jgi:cobalt-zinc-cadmium resistance protein CzcA
LPGIDFNFSQYIQDNIEEAISGVKGANSAKIIGPNLKMLEKLASQIRDQMGQVKGIEDLSIFHVVGQPNLNIKVDRGRAARYGLNTGDVNTVIQAAMSGTTATTVLEGDRQFSLVVRLAPEYRDSIEAVGNIKVGYQTPAGSTVYIPLRELATITLDTGASYIYHETTKRFIPIKFSVRGRDLGSTVAEAQQRIASNVKLPTGYRLVWAGEFEDLELAQKRLEVIVPISLLLIVVLLYGLFNSLRDSLLALASVPFAICGGVIALYVSGLPFSISAAIGFISLFGVSVMNGILIITYYNQLRAGGMRGAGAIFRAAEQRMRPALMTSLSACIGLLPAALSTGIGSQVQRPLATVVVGGMLIGPVLLLLVVPALQVVFLRDDDEPSTETPGGRPEEAPLC